MIVNNRELEPFSVWKHFQGHKFSFIGVAEVKKLPEDFPVTRLFTAVHESSQKSVNIYKGNDKYIISLAELEEDEYILYMALYGDYCVYARPKKEFLSKIDRKQYNYAKQDYRFEKLSYDIIGDRKVYFE